MKGRMIGVGFSKWKAANIAPLLSIDSKHVCFVRDVVSAKRLNLQPHDILFFWSAQAPQGVLDLARDCGSRVMHVEDGFIRSVGLGSDLIRPMSLVLDERGIYFDATRESDLEHILNSEQFTHDELTRARAIRNFIVQHNITKYNLDMSPSVQWPTKRHPILLVPGQVEDDASIRLGCSSIKTNLELLEAVRQRNPDAWIVYKPHPDVLSFNRKGRLNLNDARRFSDHVETEAGIIGCVNASDEVHTMTSLTGFDALLRGKRVVTYGQPFYAGWGLTEDLSENRTAFTRRTRRLHLDEMVAAVLMRYPIYWNWQSRSHTTCETVLHRIVEERTALDAAGKLEKLRNGFIRRQGRKLAVLVRVWAGQ